MNCVFIGTIETYRKSGVDKVNKAYKFRMYPTNEQKTMFAKTFGCSRFIYNKMLEDKIGYYKTNKEMLNNTPAQYKVEFEFLKEVDSLALANAQINLQTAFSNFFRLPKVGFPKFKSKHKSRMAYTTNNQRGSIRIEDNKIKLPKVGYVKIKKHREIPEHYILKSATVSKTRTGKYYVSVLFEYEETIEPVEIQKVVGLDFSMSGLFVSSDNEFANYPRYYRNSLSKLQKEQRKLSKCQKDSNNRSKQRLKVARLHEKVTNQRRDFLHQLSRKITNSYDAVCIENLNMQGMSQALNFGKSVHDNSWGTFTTLLSYKIKDAGKRLIKIDKWFPSSKTCSGCGAVKDELSLSERIYTCSCGLELDRDINAAINIKNQGLLLI